MLAWLLRCRCLARYCLRPREDGTALVSNAPPHVACAQPDGIDTLQNLLFLGANGADSGHTPFTSLDSHTSKMEDILAGG